MFLRNISRSLTSTSSSLLSASLKGSLRGLSSLYVQYEPNIEVRRRIEDKIYGVVQVEDSVSFAKYSHMRNNGFELKNVYFPRKGAHSPGYAFAYLPQHAAPETLDEIFKRYNGFKVDEETSLVVLKSSRADSLYLALKVDFEISKPLNENKLVETFKKFGNVTSISLPRTKGLGYPLGFGFVTFEKLEAAEAAFKEVNGKMSWRNFPFEINFSRASIHQQQNEAGNNQ